MSLRGARASRRRPLWSAHVVRAALLAALAAPAGAQVRPLTLDDLYDPDKKLDFSGPSAAGVQWVDDTRYLWPERGRDGTAEWFEVDAATGRSAPFIDAAKLEAALRALPGVSADEARRIARPRALATNPSRTALLLTIADDLYLYDRAANRIDRLTASPGAEQDATFSPDGRFVAYTRNHDLFVVEIATGRERALTTDGSAALLNGRLDWVYQEEIYGRGNYRAFWWSPDSSRLAFLQLAEQPVPEFTLIDLTPVRPALEVFDYPKAGDPNPTVRLGVVRAIGGDVRWIDTSRYSGDEHLIVNVSWTPDARSIVYQVQDREQTWLDLNLGDASTGATRTLFRETTKAWVDNHGDPTWLKDGSFLWFSERDGWKHLYHYRGDGTLVRRVTSGRWEVRTLHGVDEADGWIYFAGTERSPIGLDLYRVKLDGSGLTRLSGPEGTHAAIFSPSFRFYVGTWSSVTTPPQIRLHAADGRELRVIDRKPPEALAHFRLSAPEFVQVTTRDGFVMEAMLLKPPDFDPTRRYPVYQHTYGGPHAPQVRNAWGGTTYLYHQLLAQHGLVVWICDNRSASGKGAESAWHAYKRLGETELADIEDGLAWLKQQPWVDASRIGINGWSYGGFMVSYALTHSRSFAMGIAGGSVTDWRLYDSIYTERYMLMPQHNPEGYARTAPRLAAANLHGSLLLVHGLMDDNVHAQNTIQFAHELQKAGKRFELMVYATERHGIADPKLVKHMRATMLDFILRTLTPSAGAPTGNARP